MYHPFDLIAPDIWRSIAINSDPRIYHSLKCTHPALNKLLDKECDEYNRRINTRKYTDADGNYVEEYVTYTYMEIKEKVRNSKCVFEKVWKKNGLMHRDGDLPAYMGYILLDRDIAHKFKQDKIMENPNGGKSVLYASYLSWYKNGELHRDNDKWAVCKNNIQFEWYQNGLLHRENDKGAVICMLHGKVMDMYWYKRGKRHRDNDEPAYHGIIGWKWYVNDELHRDGDLPAVITHGGTLEWYKHDKLHRDNDRPARVKVWDNNLRIRQTSFYEDEYTDRTFYTRCSLYWYIQGELHRDNDLPAKVDGFGNRCWYKNGKLHRDNYLPAIMHMGMPREYWIEGINQSGRRNRIRVPE